MTSDRQKDILGYIEEIENILDGATGFPLSSKVMVDPAEIREILNEITESLPQEIAQAKWIKDERARIMDEAKKEYDRLLSVAKERADQLVENDDITLRAKKRADEIMTTTEKNMNDLKLGTFAYIDDTLRSFQEKIDHLNTHYVQLMYSQMSEMMEGLGNTLSGMSDTLTSNRGEIQDLSERTMEEARSVQAQEPESEPARLPDSAE